MHSFVFTKLYYVEPPKTPRRFDPRSLIIRESVPKMILYNALKITQYVGAIVICSAQNQILSLHFEYLSVVFIPLLFISFYEIQMNIWS